jgi:hypothetical protein
MPGNYSGAVIVAFAGIVEPLGVDKLAARLGPDLGMGAVPQVVHAGCALSTGCHERGRHFGFEN